MRIGLLTTVGDGPDARAALLRDAEAADRLGLDLLWLEAAGGGDALVAAAFLAARTSAVRLVACAPATAHPIHVAEEAVVADLASGGRLGLVLEQAGATAELLAEVAEVVLAATGPRPFRHAGPRWTLPAAGAGRLAVTPQPAQLELPVWLAGPDGASAARALGLSHVSLAEAGAAAEWAAAAGARRRPAVRPVACTHAGDVDDAALARALARESDLWGLDVAILRLPPWLGAEARSACVERLATRVRPRLQMDAVPAHVVAGWASA
jgi:alkanesulfonate monooxygenase SsuD/methylene tetrahydromethanopterin reductase-like flavin-dependent oxidoreductase (luciferase family)